MEPPLTCSTAASTPAAQGPRTGITPPASRGATPEPPEPESKNGFSWRRGKSLGSGSYGCVYRALDDDGLIFAVKEASVKDGSEEDSGFRAKLEDELRICKNLRHKHIVSYLGHDYQDGQLLIYLEYVAGGSMQTVLREFGPLDSTLMRVATRGLLEGLNYLHTCDPPVVHRDIKSANVLVDLDFCVKLADFGCSKRDDVTRSFTTAGSILWMAPEVIQQQSGHGRKADLWSLGCTLIEMASAERPWGNNTFDNFVAAVRTIGLSNATPPIPGPVSPSARDLIQRCVRRSPEERPWASALLGHEFVCETATMTASTANPDGILVSAL